jgi:hypothetical protein
MFRICDITEDEWAQGAPKTFAVLLPEWDSGAGAIQPEICHGYNLPNTASEKSQGAYETA